MFESFIFYMLATSILFILSSSAVTSRRDKSILYGRSALVLLIICIILNISSYNSQFQDKGIALYHGLFYTTAITHVFSIFIFIISLLIIQLNSFYGRKIWNPNISVFKLMFNKLIYYNRFILNKMAEQYRIIEYSVIILFIITGGVLLMSSCNFISVFLCIELQSYGLYILCSLYRNSEKAVEAGLTYFLLGGLSSCFILLGLALIYGNSGNVSFDGLFILNSAGNIWDDITVSYEFFVQSYYVNYALIIMSIGFLFKVTAAPFHFWGPDVYDAIPTIVTTFVAIFTKISIFILLLHVVNSSANLFKNDFAVMDLSFNLSWTYTFLISSLLSMIIGSVLGLTQFRIKRLYAYSTINHVGFILLALTITSIDSIQSFIFYLLQYSLANVNAFLLLIAIGYSLYIYTEKKGQLEYNTAQLSDVKNSPLQLVSQLKGFFYINPAIAVSLAITLFSFVGIPPLVGFFAKQMVLSSALENGYVFMSLIAILTSVISAYYYLALVKQIFFLPTDYEINSQLKNMQLKGTLVNNNNEVINNITIEHKDIKINSYLSITISVITLIMLLFILAPQEWLSLANVLALILYNN